MGTSSTVLLPYTPASVAVARRRLTDDLRGAGIRERAAADAALVVSELLSNALRHAHPLPGGLVRVGWSLTDGMIEVTVSDGGAVTRPRAARPPLSSLGGRGLSIVSHLTWRWGVRTDGAVTTVWAMLPAPGNGHSGGNARGETARRNGDTGSGEALAGTGAGSRKRAPRTWRARLARHGPAESPGYETARDNPP